MEGEDCVVEPLATDYLSGCLATDYCPEPVATDYHPNRKNKYARTLKTIAPYRRSTKQQYKEEFPQTNAGCLSYATFGWMTRFMWSLYKKGLEGTAIWECPHEMSANVNLARIQRLWEEELQRKGAENASLAWVVYRSVKTRFIISTIFYILFLTFSLFSSAFLVRSILEYSEKNISNIGYGLSLVLALFVSEVSTILTFCVAWAINYESGVRVKAGLLALLFHKILKLRSLKHKSVGELVNMCSNDGQRFFDSTVMFGYLVGSPVSAVAVLVYTMYFIGPWSILGFTILVLFYPCQALLSKITTYLRRKCIKVTDTRVRMMNEILTCVKLIKMYAWEKPFAKTISAIRAKERQVLERAAYLQSISRALGHVLPTLAVAFTYIGHTLSGNSLTAAQAFTLVAVYSSLRFSISMMPFTVKSLADTKVSLARLKDVLLMEERKPHKWRVPKPNMAIFFNGATLAWDAVLTEDDREAARKAEKADRNIQKFINKTKSSNVILEKNTDVGNESEKLHPDTAVQDTTDFTDILFDINLVLEKGCLMGVCGSVGSGKSSLISAVLAQMRLVKGEVAVEGTISYVAQQAWVLNATVKENILFGSPFDKDRYEAALHACSLSSDLSIFPAGDETEIGERGINLSGGQKQRLGLARALYADSDIFLLDDPLSAVDAHVGHHIFKHCIKGALAGKTILLITHQLQYLNQCDQVVYMKNGRIAAKGSHQSLMNDNEEYENLIKSFHGDEDSTDDESETDSQEYAKATSVESKTSVHLAVPSPHLFVQGSGSCRSLLDVSSFASVTSIHTCIEDMSASGIGLLIEAEELQEGSVSWPTYSNYFKSMGGYLVLGLVMFTFILNSACLGFSNWWLSYWISQGSGNTSIAVGNITVISSSITDNPQLKLYNLIYGMSVVFLLAAAAFKGFVFMKTTLRASSNLHDTVFSKVFQCPMSFFDATPTGRILNRFSKDMDEIDVRLPNMGEQFIQNSCHVLLSILMVAAVFYWALLAIVPIAVLFIAISRWFRVAIRQLKRLDNTTRSPLFSHITSSVQGLPTIHAFGKSVEFLKKFEDLLDTNTMPFYLFYGSLRWFSFRLNFITIFLTTVTALLIIVIPTDVISPALAGLALSFAMQVTGLFQYTVRLGSETEALMTSVERINHYVENLECEGKPVADQASKPDPDWPTRGNIQFERLKLRYRPNLPLVLKGITCDITSEEKIGIVGRTGAGKSSLGAALFRLVEASSGRIVIDGYDISKIALADLRSKLAIVPQDPVLFVGTIRYNLDPFTEYTDDAIWIALEKCHVKEMIKLLDKQLDSKVVENGENFSVGERQLICMARALLRNSKILVLDEATAAIDTATDVLIQATIKEAFAHCTMLTIAHRINTIMNSDRIILLDDGKIIEFDKPSVLLSDPESAFSKMVKVIDDQKIAAIGGDITD